jgi:uncharacterized protein (TIGR02145 family)
MINKLLSLKILSFVFSILLSVSSFICFCQNGISINTSGTAADNSAILDVSSTSQGLLIPRITTLQRNSIITPAESLVIYNTNTQCFEAYNSVTSRWVSISCPGSFNCGGSLTDRRDGQLYKTILLGTQCWMAQNLNATKFSNGNFLPKVTDNTTWTILTAGAYCYYNNDSAAYSNTYGALYNWYATSDSRGLCPTGWHIPAFEEWALLIDYLGGNGIAGDSMKEEGTAHWINNDAGANNSSGFTALPAGRRNYSGDGTFAYLGNYCDWWTATEISAAYAWECYIGFANGNGGLYYYDKIQIGHSVRCLKD